MILLDTNILIRYARTADPSFATVDTSINTLHASGYTSIGCTHCTLPGAGREGRWAGLDKTECGLHTTADDTAIAEALA